MASRRDRTRTRVDGDGVRVRRSAGVRRDVWIVVVAGVVVVGLLVSPRLRGERPAAAPAPTDAPLPASAASPEPVAAGTPTMTVTGETAATSARAEDRRRRVIARRIARKLPRTRGPDGRPELRATDAIAALREAGVTDGIAAFPPPGTDPPKTGVIVPEGIELPEGYVRHHQSTDEGEALAPILLFHPDYDFFDDAGDPIDVPADRVVPPDLVPPGIPVRVLELPESGSGS